MKKERIYIGRIPALLWGERQKKAFLYVHGQGGRKEDAENFATIAASDGWQVLSVDLPEHGERTGERDSFDPWHAVPELQETMGYAKSHWKSIELCANSIGAWFSMLSFADEGLERCLFVSPILDMNRLIANMMRQAGVTEERLRRERTIATNFGYALSWEYWSFANSHPITHWNIPTNILYGGKDNLTERDVAERFAERCGCELTVLEDGEHWFHTPEQLNVLNEWTRSRVGGSLPR